MNFFTNPQTAKLRLVARPYFNALILIIIFLIVAVVFKSLILDIVITGILFLIFIFLNMQPIGFVCTNPKCGRYIEANRPWICGNNDAMHRNDNTDEFSFLQECKECHHEPKSYKCHHCGNIIFLTRDHSPVGFARCADIAEKPRPSSPPNYKESHADIIARKRAELEITELKIKQARMEAELREADEALKPKKQKTDREILEEKARAYKERFSSIPEIVAQWKADNAKKFKKDSDDLRRADLLADQWALNQADV